MGNILGCCTTPPPDYDGELSLFAFEMHRVIGKGAFGKVRIVQSRRNQKLYALKYIDKARCVKQKAVSNIIQERKLLEEIDNTFVVNLRFAFQDDENCFFVLDLMLGGDLRFLLERQGHVNESAVRFYMAELSSGLRYLHSIRILHRDLKPDNVLLDGMGHVHISDFNVAIHYSEKRLHTSVAGSSAYMSPEMVTKKGYSWPTDWWSLGVLAYELLFGRRPFEGRGSDAMNRSIAHDHLRFPESSSRRVSQSGIDFVKGLLCKDPNRRLVCKPRSTTSSVKFNSNPWFSSIDWESLEAKEATPPIVPDMNKANFDISHELDEFLMVDKPLTAHKRKANQDLQKMKPELRQLEEQFTNYDFLKMRRQSYYPANEPLMVMPQRDAPPLAVVPSQASTPVGSPVLDDPQPQLPLPPSHLS